MRCGKILRRATIFVGDAEKSANFYQSALGFSIYSDQRITLRAGSPVTVGYTDEPRPGRFITVKGTNALTGMIGLISIENDVPNLLDGGRLGIGSVVLVIEAEQIESAEEKIRDAGGQIIMPLHDAENTAGNAGEKIPSRRLFAKDPDGYVLEVFEPTT